MSDTTIAQKPAKRKRQIETIAAQIERLHLAGAQFVLLRGEHPEHRIDPKTGELAQKAAFERRWRQRRPTVARAFDHALHDGWLGIVPASLGWLALDKDSGSIRELLRWLRGRGIEYKSLKTPNGHHALIRVAGMDIGNWNWRAAGCAGELRHAKGYVVMYDLAAWTKELAAARALLADEALQDFIAAIRTANGAPGGSDNYDTAKMNHGREVFRHVLMGKETPSWAGHVAMLEGMGAADIKANEQAAADAALTRHDKARAWMRETGLPPRRMRDMLGGMHAVAGDGLICDAAQETIGLVAGAVSGRAAIHKNFVRELQKQAELQGWIERLPDRRNEREKYRRGTRRGSPPCVWKLKKPATIPKVLEQFPDRLCK